MKRIAPLLALLFLPVGAFAATTSAAQSLVFMHAGTHTGNVYLAGGSVTVATSTPADLTVAGGSVFTSASVGGDLLAAGGSVAVHGTVHGDARLIGGRVSVAAPVDGDLVVMAPSIEDTGSVAKSIIAFGGAVHLLAGAQGAVTAYGNDVYLAGTFDGDVRVTAVDRLVLAPGTVVHGSLRYEASEAATIPDSAQVDGGVTYTGASFLPTTQEAEAFALAGIGIFFLVRILGALILSGLFAGLFPTFTEDVVEDVFAKPVRHALLMTLLGFGIAVATPVLLSLLAITFVGIGLAVLIGAAYLLLMLAAFAYAGVIVGAAFARRFTKRSVVTWRHAVFGMLVLMVVGAVPVIGGLVIALLTCLAVGVLASIFYTFAFHRAYEELS